MQTHCCSTETSVIRCRSTISDDEADEQMRPFQIIEIHMITSCEQHTSLSDLCGCLPESIICSNRVRSSRTNPCNVIHSAQGRPPSLGAGWQELISTHTIDSSLLPCQITLFLCLKDSLSVYVGCIKWRTVLSEHCHSGELRSCFHASRILITED